MCVCACVSVCLYVYDRLQRNKRLAGYCRQLIMFQYVFQCCSQFLFMVVFTTFLVSCLRFHILWVDTIPFEKNNQTGQRDVIVSDLFDLSGFDRLVVTSQLSLWCHTPCHSLCRINPIVVLFLLMAIVFWIHRLFRTAVRFYRWHSNMCYYVLCMVCTLS